VPIIRAAAAGAFGLRTPRPVGAGLVGVFALLTAWLWHWYLDPFRA